MAGANDRFSSHAIQDFQIGGVARALQREAHHEELG
jgi:hypothetical protein